MAEKLSVSEQVELVAPNSNVLNEVALEVSAQEIVSKDTHALIRQMIKIAQGEQGDVNKRTMVGLASPQVGASKRIIIVDVATTGMGETPELRAYINPKIIRKSEQVEQGREGCYSTGNVCGNVDRSSEVTIEAYNQEGNLVSETWTGFTARIFQHEIDHLDGIRFPDRITDDAKLHWVETDKFGEYRTKWADWQELCSREQWEVIKSGSVPTAG